MSKSKKGARPFGWRSVIFWTISPIPMMICNISIMFPVYHILSRIFGEQTIYDSDTIYFGLVCFEYLCIGLSLGIVQAWSLPPILRDFRAGWFWRTAVPIVSVMISIAFINDGYFWVHPIKSLDVYIRWVPIYLIACVPLLLFQSRYLYRMTLAYQGYDDRVIGFGVNTFEWLWWVPNILLILTTSLVVVQNFWSVMASFTLWGFGNGLVIYLILNHIGNPIPHGTKPAPATSTIQ